MRMSEFGEGERGATHVKDWDEFVCLREWNHMSEWIGWLSVWSLYSMNNWWWWCMLMKVLSHAFHSAYNLFLFVLISLFLIWFHLCQDDAMYGVYVSADILLQQTHMNLFYDRCMVMYMMANCHEDDEEWRWLMRWHVGKKEFVWAKDLALLFFLFFLYFLYFIKMM